MFCLLIFIFPLKMAFFPISVESYFFSAECKSFIIFLFLFLLILLYTHTHTHTYMDSYCCFYSNKVTPSKSCSVFPWNALSVDPKCVAVYWPSTPRCPMNQEDWKWINSLSLEISSFIMPLPLGLSLHLFIEIFMSSSEVPSPILSTGST